MGLLFFLEGRTLDGGGVDNVVLPGAELVVCCRAVDILIISVDKTE